MGLGRGLEERLFIVEVSFIFMVGIAAGPETEIVGTSGRTIEGIDFVEIVNVGMGLGATPFIWIAGGSGS